MNKTMNITVKDVLNKYPTEFNLNDVTSKLANTIIITDNNNSENNALILKNVSLNDLKKPEHTKTGEHDKYTYKLKEHKIIIDNYLGKYSVEVRTPSPEGIVGPYTSRWEHDGNEVLL